MAKTKQKIKLKYSLLDEKFKTALGKRQTEKLQNAIADWKGEPDKKNEDALISAFMESLLAFWKKSKMKDFKGMELKKEFDLVVDLVHRKGRKPNTLQLDNNQVLKKELLKLLK